jgi:hypothetical protein
MPALAAAGPARTPARLRRLVDLPEPPLGRSDDMASEHTVADDIVYDLVSIQYHALKGAEVYDRYIEDAHEHDDVVEFIRHCKDDDNHRATRAHELLRQLTIQRDGIG